jgi:hypothetical protein
LTAALHSDDSKIQRLAFETIYRCAESDLIDSHIDRASAPSSTVPVPERIPLRGSLRSVVADGYETCGVVMSKMALIFGAADLPAHHQCQPAPDNGKLAIVLLDMQPSLRVFAAKKALFVAAVTRSVSRHGQPVSMTSPHYTSPMLKRSEGKIPLPFRSHARQLCNSKKRMI